MRNLNHDKDVIKQLLAVTPMDIPPMFSEIAALHAIERAIVAEAKVEEMQKTLKQWENFAIYLTKITSCSMTKNEISHALNTFAQKGESQ